MTEQNPEAIGLNQTESGVLVTGSEFSPDAGNQWSVERLDEKRVLLTVAEGRLGVNQAKDALKAVASLSVDSFREFFLGLVSAKWSGALHVDTGYGLKKVYLTKGEIVFAASSVIDDRLGEVIYREAKISLDELTDTAAQVTKARKFGQVLLANGRVTNMELWNALKLQVTQILRSLFMAERVFFEMQEGAGLAPTEVVFEEPTLELVSECVSFGAAYRAFLRSLRSESTVSLLHGREQLAQTFRPGTFVGDLLDLVETCPYVQDLLNTSKLIDNYTLSALLNLVNLGVCKVTPEMEPERKAQPWLAPLKARLDGYAYVLSAVRKAFADGKKEFPVTDLAQFASRVNPDGFPSVFVDAAGELCRPSVATMLVQCATNASRVAYFTVRVEALIQFLMQIAGDNLDFQVAKKIRQEYRAIS